jgi:hypothetical protein
MPLMCALSYVYAELRATEKGANQTIMIIIMREGEKEI